MKLVGGAGSIQHTVAVFVAAPLEAPNAREARAAVRLSIANSMQAASALETGYGGAEGGEVAVMCRWRCLDVMDFKGEVVAKPAHDLANQGSGFLKTQRPIAAEGALATAATSITSTTFIPVEGYINNMKVRIARSAQGESKQ